MKKIMFTIMLLGTMVAVERISYEDGSIVDFYYQSDDMTAFDIKVIRDPYINLDILDDRDIIFNKIV